MFLTRANEPLRWSSAIGEILLIVCGVLIALAVDATWDQRQENAARQNFIQFLERDYSANAEVVGAALAATKADVEQVQFTLEMIYSDETVDPLVVRRALMSNSWDLNSSNGAHIGAVNSGQLQLIPAEVLLELARIPAAIVSVRRNSDLFLQLGYFGP